MKKLNKLQARALELQLKHLRDTSAVQRSVGEVPCKKKSKPLGYKMQNTFERSVQGVPGGKSLIRQMDAKGTGCKVRKEEIGPLRSARNANTTSGNYVTTIVREGDKVVSDRQGRKEFGR